MRALSRPFAVWLLLVASLVLVPTTWCLAEDSDPAHPKLNMVLYVPSDVDPPADIGKRFIQIAAYTEQYLVSEMTRAGYPPEVKQIFPRDEKGNFKFLFVKGEHKADSDRWEKGGVNMEIIEAAVKKYELPRSRHVWWIWMYLGDPPKRYSNYRGAGNSIDGGWAICNYTNIPGEIDPKVPLAAGFHFDFTLKACIHELGHGFGLPHLGPMARDRRGNTLMGPQAKVYAKKVDDRKKDVYLCDASAAMLWKHPIFSGTHDQRGQKPQFKMKNLKGEFNRQGRYLELTGDIETDIPAHSVVVIEEGTDGYFRKSFAGRVDEKGHFSVDVKELDHEKGDLRILFCFENGICTGDGKGFGDQSALTQPYEVTRRGIELIGAGD
ncbi:hypothetical protein AB1L30_02700 [Bremerella sp. JC817]|uniref:hypothetical protein n=1 Tax=Bremerella sp. JC817 TaxID=3231756 RepID=UPI00345B362D